MKAKDNEDYVKEYFVKGCRNDKTFKKEVQSELEIFELQNEISKLKSEIESLKSRLTAFGTTATTI